MSKAIPDIRTARRCVEACAKYLRTTDDSPLAARDLIEAVRVIEESAEARLASQEATIRTTPRASNT